MTADERSKLIENIRALPQQVEAAVAGLSDSQLDTPYRDGGWTVRQVVHHLADSHMNAFVRMKLILTEDHPTLKPYDQDAWASLPDTTHSPIGSALALLRGLHERWVALLQSLHGEAWMRSAHHPESGEMTVEDLLRIYSRHGVKHVEQITTLRKERGW